jgi:hypothetical protein
MIGGNLLKRLLQRFKPAHREPEAGRAVEDRSPPTTIASSSIRQTEPIAEKARPESREMLHGTPVVAPLIPVVLGLDFGTFSTKVIARRRNERTAVVLQLDEPCAGYPAFALPSLIRLTDGKVFFGRCAAEAVGGVLLRSLKVSLLTGCSQGPGVADPGYHGLTVDGLVALYLSWVLARTRRWLDGEYGPNRVNLFVNAAAPMDHYEDPNLRERYLRIVNCAWSAVFGPRPVAVEQGVTVHSLGHWLSESLDPGTEIEPSETRRFDILPESVAPIVSLSHDPRMRGGMYLIVDMGAGTTEFSVNHAPEPGGNQKVLCYYDQSILLGAEQFDAPPLGESDESLTNRLLRSLCRTWGEGYIKDARNHAARQRWKELTVLLAGGGTCRPGLRERIERHQTAVMYAFSSHDCKYSVKTHVPAGLEFRPPSAGAQADAFLLSVAHGLSFPRRTWPEFFEPSQVEPLGEAPRRPRPDLPWFEVG